MSPPGLPCELLRICQVLVHYGLHLAAPGLIARLFFRERYKRAWLVLIATMLVDLDHLLSYPEVFVPARCSIQLHPLHTYWAMVVYAALTVPARTRLVGIGLLFHMLTDGQDCLWSSWLRETCGLH